MVKLEQILKEARIKRGLTLEEAAKATKIKLHFLELIERGQYGDLPSPAYARGFVRNYADFLGLPKLHSNALFKRDFDEKKSIKVLPDGISKTQEFPIRRIDLRKIFFGFLFIATLLIFFLFQIRGIVFAPDISILEPKQQSVVTSDVSVKGRTDSSATVVINNEPVFVNSDGEFEKKITLFPGKNLINITAKNRFGKESSIQREVIVK